MEIGVIAKATISSFEIIKTIVHTIAKQWDELVWFLFCGLRHTLIRPEELKNEYKTIIQNLLKANLGNGKNK